MTFTLILSHSSHLDCFLVSIVYQLSFIITHHSIYIQHSSLIYCFIHYIPSALILSHPSHLECFLVSIVYHISFITIRHSKFSIFIFHLLFHSSISLLFNSITSLPYNVFYGLNSLSSLFYNHSLFNIYSIFIIHLSFHSTHDFRYNSITSLPSGLFSSLSGLWSLSKFLKIQYTL